jgi:hypothetical protein
MARRYRGNAEQHRKAAARQGVATKRALATARRYIAGAGSCFVSLTRLVDAAVIHGMYGTERTWAGRAGRRGPRGSKAIRSLEFAFLRRCGDGR